MHHTAFPVQLEDPPPGDPDQALAGVGTWPGAALAGRDGAPW